MKYLKTLEIIASVILLSFISSCNRHEEIVISDVVVFEKYSSSVVEDTNPETEEFDQILHYVKDESVETSGGVESEPAETEIAEKYRPSLSELSIAVACEIHTSMQSFETASVKLEDVKSIAEGSDITEEKIEVKEYVSETKLLESPKVEVAPVEVDWFDPDEVKSNEIDVMPVVENPVTTASTWVRYYTDSQYAEYPVACQVWQILRSWGWNEAVSAGIIGNMMTECGGLTLDLDWDLYDDTWMYYGLCMWSLYWAPETAGLSIADQMTYLYNTIETNMDYFGGNLKEFLSITDPGYAALYFQWYYEVGISSETRYAGALEAYEYFRTK